MQCYTLRQAHGKPIPVKLTAKIERHPNAPFDLLTIKQRGETDSYLLQELPDCDDDERAFELYRPESDPVNRYIEAKDAGHTVRIDCRVPALDNCTCAGHNYLGRCKHVDALRGLITAGELPHPDDRSGNEALGDVGETAIESTYGNVCERCGVPLDVFETLCPKCVRIVREHEHAIRNAVAPF